MPRPSIKIVNKQFDAAWTDLGNWQSLYQEAYEFSLPSRNPYKSGDPTQTPVGGQRKDDRIFDSTLPNATVRLANRLQSELCPPGTTWGRFKPGALLKDAQKEEAQRELENIETAAFAALHLSNFDQSINEWFLELIAAGTAIMGVMEGADSGSPADFVCLPQSQVALMEGPNGKIWGFHRKHMVMIALIQDQWADAKPLPKELADKIDPEHGDPAAEVMLYESLYYSSKDTTWFYDVIWRDGGDKQDGGFRFVERTYRDGYWIATRWTKSTGEVRGRSTVMNALADTKTLNKLKELLLMNASLAVKGVTLVNRANVINPDNVRIRPGAQIPVRGDPRLAMMALPIGGDLRLSQFIIQEMQDAINLAMLNRSLPPDNGPVRSPTEIVARLKELQMDLGAPLGRVVTEGLIPIMQLFLGVLGRKGIVPLAQGGRAIPLNGAMVKFEVTSPLVQAQNLADVEAYTNWAQIQLSTIGKEAFLLGTKVEDVGEYLSEKMGVSQKLVRPANERMKIQQFIGALIGQQMNPQPPVAANQNGGGVAQGAALPVAA